MNKDKESLEVLNAKYELLKNLYQETKHNKIVLKHLVACKSKIMIIEHAVKIIKQLNKINSYQA